MHSIKKTPKNDNKRCLLKNGIEHLEEHFKYKISWIKVAILTETDTWFGPVGCPDMPTHYIAKALHAHC